MDFENFPPEKLAPTYRHHQLGNVSNSELLPVLPGVVLTEMRRFAIGASEFSAARFRTRSNIACMTGERVAGVARA